MATEQELIDGVNALPDTQAFFAPRGSVTAVGTPLNDGSGFGDKGAFKTYTHIKNVDANRVQSGSVKIYINPLAEAFFVGSNPVPASKPSPRTTVKFVTTHLGGAVPESVNIARDGNLETVHVTVDSGSGAVKDGERRVYEITYDDAGKRTGIRRITNPSAM